MPGDSTLHPHKRNVFHQLKAWQRLTVAILVAIFVWLIIPPNNNKYFTAIVVLDFFALAYLLLCWMALLTMTVPGIRRKASFEDGSKPFVFIMIILASLAGMISVLLLVRNNYASINKMLFLLVSLSGIIFSWAIVHTVFTFHYAHLYYRGKTEGGLEFPGDEKPGYLDFAYFSFGIGCTFQVADVEVSSARIRKLVLFHSLLSFMLNTFVVALSINIISGIVK